METFKRWEPVEGIAWPSAGVDFTTTADSLDVRVNFSVIDGGTRDLLLRWDWRTLVHFGTWEELAHPMIGAVQGPLPELLVGKKPTWTFPLLEVSDSHLIEGLGVREAAYQGYLRHFRIVTLDHTVDILAVREPTAAWV